MQKALTVLKSIDLVNNPVVDQQGYKTRMFELIPTLVILDGYNKEGEEVFSESDESEYGAYGEEGEDEEDFINDGANLSEEQLAELKRRGMSIEQYMAQAKRTREVGESGSEEYDDEQDYGEDGESDYDEEAEEEAGGKRGRDADSDESEDLPKGPAKRAKH